MAIESTTTPPAVPGNNPPPPPQEKTYTEAEVTQRVEAARQEEKQKLYSEIDSLKTQLKDSTLTGTFLASVSSAFHSQLGIQQTQMEQSTLMHQSCRSFQNFLLTLRVMFQMVSLEASATSQTVSSATLTLWTRGQRLRSLHRLLDTGAPSCSRKSFLWTCDHRRTKSFVPGCSQLLCAVTSKKTVFPLRTH